MPTMEAHGIDTIFLVAPTTTQERMARITQHAKGFIYDVVIKRRHRKCNH